MALRVKVTAPDKSVAAYKLGSIEDHTDILTGETTPAAQVAAALKEQAEADTSLAGSTFKIEELVDNGDGTSTWK